MRFSNRGWPLSLKTTRALPGLPSVRRTPGNGRSGLRLNGGQNFADNYADPAARPASEWTADQRRAYAIHHPRRTPRQIVERYPAHLHLNLLERAQGRGAGTMLFSEWMARAGVGATHVGVNSANVRAVRFWSRGGFDRLKLKDGGSDRTIWMGRS
jgi:GNAT superfamily N-acetyltransferase